MRFAHHGMTTRHLHAEIIQHFFKILGRVSVKFPIHIVGMFDVFVSHRCQLFQCAKRIFFHFVADRIQLKTRYLFSRFGGQCRIHKGAAPQHRKSALLYKIPSGCAHYVIVYSIEELNIETFITAV